MAALPPIVPRGELHKRSLRSRMLEYLVDDPPMKTEKLAALVGATTGFVSAMRKSDTFQNDLAIMIKQKYGAQLEKTQRAVLETQAAALERLERQLKNDALPDVTHQAAAQIALDHSVKYQQALTPVINPNAPAPAAVALTINIDQLSRARQLSLQHSREITLEPSDASHAKPLAEQEHSYLTARSQEGDEV